MCGSNCWEMCCFLISMVVFGSHMFWVKSEVFPLLWGMIWQTVGRHTTRRTSRREGAPRLGQPHFRSGLIIFWSLQVLRCFGPRQVGSLFWKCMYFATDLFRFFTILALLYLNKWSRVGKRQSVSPLTRSVSVMHHVSWCLVNCLLIKKLNMQWFISLPFSGVAD